MSKAKSIPSPTRNSHWARRTHRLIAIVSLLFLFLIALTGLILNHADTLGLGNRHATGPVMLRLYGIEAPPVETAFEAGGILFATSADVLYANASVLAHDVSALRGVVADNNAIVAATASEFLVATDSGRLIERLESDSRGVLTRLGLSDGRIIAEIGARYFAVDPQQISLSEIEVNAEREIDWSLPQAPDAEQLQRLTAATLGQSLNWQRVLNDLHSGRILPTVGRYIADIAAMCLLYLCITGIVLWLRRYRKSSASVRRSMHGIDGQ